MSIKNFKKSLVNIQENDLVSDNTIVERKIYNALFKFTADKRQRYHAHQGSINATA